MRILLYGNGSAENHGCEAIVRGLHEQFESHSLYVASEDRQADEKYELNQISEILDSRAPVARNLIFWKAYFQLKLKKDYSAMDLLPYWSALKRYVGAVDIAFSIGGDNYCYGNHQLYAGLNKAYIKSGIKTVLWGCSIEPDLVRIPEVAEDLKRYSLIVARESLTYEAVKKVQENTLLIPDSAFYMEAEECELASFFQEGQVIGVNMSPMIESNEKIPGITLNNYIQLIEKILEETDDQIALIPHVVWESNDDRKALTRLYEVFKETGRVHLIEDHSAPQLKYIISQCRAFVGARTHATIAAYSTCVPTLVIGYSVKARGIARDLFGSEDNYVIPVQSLQTKNDLTVAFSNLMKNEENIRSHLNRFIPDYKKEGKKKYKKCFNDTWLL